MLDKYYRRIQVYFFFKQTDAGVEKAIQEALKDKSIKHTPASQPATSISKNGLGCILFFIGHLEEFTAERKDIQNIRGYHKNGVFEEICHLVEHKGDSSPNQKSFLELGELYVKALGRRKFENLAKPIWLRLFTDRNHYEVYHMMMYAYPIDWINRFYKYFRTNPVTYEKRYMTWKENTSFKIALARYVADYLRHIVVLYVAQKIPKNILSDEHKRKLGFLISASYKDIEHRKNLIKNDSIITYEILNSMNEKVFKTSDTYFPFILEIWKKANLIE